MTTTNGNQHATQEKQPIQLSLYESLGMMMWLMNHADYHSTWPLWSLDQDILPPLMLGQYKLYLDEQQNPVGFVTWAWLDDAGRDIVLEGKAVPGFKAWNAGEYLMVNDFVAPWGHAKFIANDLRVIVFPNARGFALRRNADGSIRKTYLGHGLNAVPNGCTT
ncbi:toxin-activating lysine-acyltransferase [Natronospirillum operosum]|uniref:RTX toxin-activating lysine-acyltransferase n=1 Tax=Natronospirillum operosum TaxID=2759953 RepID=A0A4Z0W8I4_9GAMM|nr:toxin-activating lysine-acyltransferase [Natronospirillum operosum]TGG90288.1 toxin-activating lysine-acyltransferase [Natronospirillum operosum]